MSSKLPFHIIKHNKGECKNLNWSNYVLGFNDLVVHTFLVVIMFALLYFWIEEASILHAVSNPKSINVYKKPYFCFEIKEGARIVNGEFFAYLTKANWNQQSGLFNMRSHVDFFSPKSIRNYASSGTLYPLTWVKFKFPI